MEGGSVSSPKPKKKVVISVKSDSFFDDGKLVAKCVIGGLVEQGGQRSMKLELVLLGCCFLVLTVAACGNSEPTRYPLAGEFVGKCDVSYSTDRQGYQDYRDEGKCRLLVTESEKNINAKVRVAVKVGGDFTCEGSTVRPQNTVRFSVPCKSRSKCFGNPKAHIQLNPSLGGDEIRSKVQITYTKNSLECPAGMKGVHGAFEFRWNWRKN